MLVMMYLMSVVLCVVPVMCGPAPQQQKTEGQHQRQDEQKHAVDSFTSALVENSNIRKNYLDCFLDNGPCSPEARNIKQMVPEAIQKECAHCTDLQRKVIEKMMFYLNTHQPEILKQVAAKFDPKGEYMKQYINAIERKGNHDNFPNPQLPQSHQSHQQVPQQPQQYQQQSTVVTTAPIATVTKKP